MELIQIHVKKTMNLASDMNASQKQTEELLIYVGDLLNLAHPDIYDHWPRGYSSAESVLKAGNLYSSVNEKAICFNKEHPLYYYTLEPGEPCPDCLEIPDIRRYYLSLKGKFQRWFSSPHMCRLMLDHWKNKDDWLHETGTSFPANEIWHGSRFKEVKWFWDPNSIWALPHRCRCENIINLEDVTQNEPPSLTITCDNCQRSETIRPVYVTGDPRNIALIGHWDGWQTGFGRGYLKGSGSIELTIANMRKKERFKNENVFVSSFVPEHKLPNKQPTALDPYLEPLVEEIEELFIDGMDIDYPEVDDEFPAGRFRVRCMMLCWTGDYPAQCQVGKFSCKGTFGCRVDKCKGESVEDGGSTKYYIGNRQKYLQRWDKRDIEIEATTMYDIEMKQSIHAKLAEATKTGYTGLTLLYRLHKLYKFNPFEDMVHDVMHLVLLNCCKKLFKRIFTEYIGNVDQFNEDMSNFPLTPELQDGHCPKHIEKCTSWTAEEWRKFAYPMAEVLLLDIPDNEYHLLWLTARVVELLFHRRDGLTNDEIKNLDKICWRRLILLEEQIGPKQCVITCHNSIHISEDISRFAHCDNFWCFNNERAVKRYKAVPTNFKNVEATYAKMEVFREMKSLEGKQIRWTHKEDDRNKVVSSLEGAKIYAENCQNLLCDDISEYIIYIGTDKFTNVHVLTDAILEATIRDGLQVEVYRNYRSCYFPGKMSHVKLESFVMFQDESIGKISEFILVEGEGEGTKYVRAQMLENTGDTVKDISIYRTANVESITSAKKIKRAVIAYPRDVDLFFIIDLNRGIFDFEHEVL
uniref:Uncharacterized protein n=3 Tax=Clytia hemisphaerica TaxID=252671 RepID=A0A7M5WW45_9CNID